MKFRAVLFDFDGILVDTEWAIYQAWLRTFREHGHDLPLEIYTRCIGSDFATWSPKSHLEDLSGMDFDWHGLDARRQEAIMAELDGSGPMSGAVELLRQLREAGLRRAVVSSSSHHWVDGWLDKLGLLGEFEQLVCRGDAPRIKPAPDLYLEAARRLDLAPADCLVIEDSMNGVISAHAAGMTAWAVPNRVTGVLDFSATCPVFASLYDVRSALHNPGG